MTKKIFKEKYPIYELVVDKSETTFKTVDEIVDHLKEKIEEHSVAVFMSIFDNYAHTTAFGVGEINEDIKSAKIVVFCFGKEIPKPDVLAVRPRSIGVTDLGDRFVIVFMEAPNPQATETMESWVKAIKNI